MKLLTLVVLAAIAQGQTAPSTTSLKDAYKGLFRIGAALNATQFEGHDPIADPIIEAQFNAISPENAELGFTPQALATSQCSLA